MPVRTAAWPPGTPCWADLAVPDLDAAKRFYGAVLGWEYTDHGEEYGDYVTCTRDGARAAGLTPMYQAGMPVAWTVYFATEDLPATVTRIQDAGGTVVFGPMQVMDLGHMALATDPTGVAFAVWQAGSNTGIEVHNAPGGLVWEEAVTPDSARAQDFYAAVFDLTFESMGGVAAFKTPVSAESIGSIGASDPDTAPHWRLWFVVEDADAAAAAAAANGGKVVGAPSDGDWGREARLLDPAGAELVVMSLNAG